MKALVLLFLTLSGSLIAWRYMDKQSKKSIKQVAGQNLAPIVIAAVVVVVALFLSMNTTLRLV
jgi:peptidoglycan/LPS O-acetylase OafA/YrhL